MYWYGGGRECGSGSEDEDGLERMKGRRKWEGMRTGWKGFFREHIEKNGRKGEGKGRGRRNVGKEGRPVFIVARRLLPKTSEGWGTVREQRKYFPEEKGEEG